MTVNNNSRLFDPFKLSEALGGDYVTSSRLMNILRLLRTKGNLVGGDIAARCGERVFRPEWQQLLNKLIEFRYIAVAPTGHGTAQLISLTDAGREFLDDAIGPEEVPAAEAAAQE